MRFVVKLGRENSQEGVLKVILPLSTVASSASKVPCRKLLFASPVDIWKGKYARIIREMSVL